MKDIGILLLFIVPGAIIAVTGAGAESMTLKISSMLLAAVLIVVALVAGIQSVAQNREKYSKR
ncbi:MULTISPECIES: hypothetical protein [Bhargavaea]|uniref:Uncharacterized protein n=1 Tax=Bhargavaea changchunensis TaxID=2134037 RepID=A0ABW2NKG3_9BACL|nr:hypothetical protein [Bhargavaea sp. CC-171006]